MSTKPNRSARRANPIRGEGFLIVSYQIQFSALWGRDVSITVPANAAQTMDDNNTGPGEPVSVSKTWTHREPEHWLLEYYKCFSLELYNKYRNDQELFQEYLDTYF